MDTPTRGSVEFEDGISTLVPLALLDHADKMAPIAKDYDTWFRVLVPDKLVLGSPVGLSVVATNGYVAAQRRMTFAPLTDKQLTLAQKMTSGTWSLPTGSVRPVLVAAKREVGRNWARTDAMVRMTQVNGRGATFDRVDEEGNTLYKWGDFNPFGVRVEIFDSLDRMVVRSELVRGGPVSRVKALESIEDLFLFPDKPDHAALAAMTKADLAEAYRTITRRKAPDKATKKDMIVGIAGATESWGSPVALSSTQLSALAATAPAKEPLRFHWRNTSHTIVTCTDWAGAIMPMRG